MPTAHHSLGRRRGAGLRHRDAYGPRDAAWVAHPYVLWEQAQDDEQHLAWGRALSADLKRFSTGGVYLNFIGDEGRDRVRAAFGDNYARLQQVKSTYDPHNYFRRNQNITPADHAGP